MKQKTKLSYRLQKKDIQGTHLAMSKNINEFHKVLIDQIVMDLLNS